MTNLFHQPKPRWYHRNESIKLNTLKPKTWATIAIIVLATSILVAVYWYQGQMDKLSFSYQPVYASAPRLDEPEAKTSEQEEIIAYVKEVFGKDAHKAFKVLSCENSALNPKAVNGAGNTPAGSLDMGLFQINNYWQKIENKAFLFDYKVNTQIAHNIYTRDGNSFKLWTCGRRFGI